MPKPMIIAACIFTNNKKRREKELGLRDANMSASVHRTKEAKTEIWLCKEGGLTVEQGGAGPVVAPGGAVR